MVEIDAGSDVEFGDETDIETVVAEVDESEAVEAVVVVTADFALLDVVAENSAAATHGAEILVSIL